MFGLVCIKGTLGFAGSRDDTSSHDGYVAKGGQRPATQATRPMAVRPTPPREELAVPEKPRMRERRKEARPAGIIDAGMRLLAEHGFEGTKLSEVARLAGVAKGTIYLYFESK